MASKEVNRRKISRVAMPCLITLHQSEIEPAVILAHTENIGTGGIGVRLSQELERFKTVNLEIDLLDAKENVKCQGKIVWAVRKKSDNNKKRMQYDTGIEFVNMNPQDIQRVERLVTRLSETEKGDK